MKLTKFELMDNLVRINEDEAFIESVVGMFADLENEGFERKDIKEFLKSKIDDIIED